MEEASDRGSKKSRQVILFILFLRDIMLMWLAILFLFGLKTTFAIALSKNFLDKNVPEKSTNNLLKFGNLT